MTARAEEDFLRFVRESGLSVVRGSRNVSAKGVRYRLTRTGKDNDLTAILFLSPAGDGSLTGVIKSYRGDTRIVWKSDRSAVCASELVQIRRQFDDERELGIKLLADSLAEYEAASACNSHRYLSAKRVPCGDELRVDSHGNLLIPLRTFGGDWCGFQRIGEAGDKRFSVGATPQKGGIYICGDIEKSELVGVAEGYATAQSIHQMTGITVVVAFSCVFFSGVVRTIRAAYPDRQIILFPDTGKSAEVASELVEKFELGGSFPPKSEIQNYDWNDAMNSNFDDARRELDDCLRIAKANPLNRLEKPTIQRIRALQEKCGTGLRFGIRLFENGGGGVVELNFRGLTVFSARTAGGKTLGLVSAAAQLLVNREDSRVLFISLEEPEHRLYIRLCSAIAVCRGDPDKMTSRNMSCSTTQRLVAGLAVDERDAPKRFAKAAEIIEDRVNIVTPENFNGVNISSILRELIAAHRRRYGRESAVFIDYAQLIRSSDVRMAYAGWTTTKAVMDDIRAVIFETGAVIFMAAQMNRIPAGEAKGDAAKEFELAQPEHLREGADLEQAAELILYLVSDRNDYFKNINVKVMKNRSGPSDLSATLPTYYDSSFVDWGRASRATLLSSDRGRENHSRNGRERVYNDSPIFDTTP